MAQFIPTVRGAQPQQRAWAKLLPAGELERDEAVATLGPDAYPPPPVDELARILDQPRHLHPLLRDQRALAGIGRSWVDEILWLARVSPFQKGAELDPDDVGRLHDAMAEALGGALEHYERVIGETVPDKLPMPLQVHRRQGDGVPGADLADIGTGTYRLLFRVLASHPEEVRSFYEDTIAPIVRYDEQYSTQLVDTLATYLGKDCNMNATAQAIHAHRHTVAYRLERVKELTGLDANSTEDRERLSLGLKAHRILAPGLPR